MAGMLEDLDHAALYNMRSKPGADQGMLAPQEHRAFAREWAQESPVIAGASLPFAIPAYQLAKLLGLQKARTPASLDELFAGYHGYAEGMLSNMVPSAHATTVKHTQGTTRMIDGTKKPMPPRRSTHGGGGVRG